MLNTRTIYMDPFTPMEPIERVIAPTYKNDPPNFGLTGEYAPFKSSRSLHDQSSIGHVYWHLVVHNPLVERWGEVP